MKQVLLFLIFLISSCVFAQDTITITAVLKDSKIIFNREINNKRQSDSVALFKDGGVIKIVSDFDLNGFKIVIINKDNQKRVLNYTVTESPLYKVVLSVSNNQIISGIPNPTIERLSNNFSVYMSRSGVNAVPANHIDAHITMKDERENNNGSAAKNGNGISPELFTVSGISLVDANILKRTASRDSILNTLGYYKESDRSVPFKSYDEAIAYFNNPATKNSFLVEYLNKIKIAASSQSDKGNNGTQSVYSVVSQGLSAAGGLDVTNIADAFAKFIVKRTKEELSVTFFERFTKAIDTVPDLKTIFPQTHRTLMTIGEEVYMYQAYIQTLRESFEKDLSSLPNNLPKIIDNHKAYFDKNPDIRAELLSGFYIAEQIQEKQHPGEMIENYPTGQIFGNDVNANIKASFQTLQLVSFSLKSGSDGDNYWASGNELKKLYTDVPLLKIYLGLLEQKAKLDSIRFQDKSGGSVALSAIIDNSYTTFSNGTQYKLFLKNLSLKLESLDAKIKGLKKRDNDSTLFESYYAVITNSIDLLDYAAEVETLPFFPQDLMLREKVQKYTDIARTTADIAVDVNRRNYSSAIVNAVSLFDNTIKEYSYRRKCKLQKLNAESESMKLNLAKITFATTLKKFSDSLKITDATLLAEKVRKQVKDKKKNTGLSDLEMTGLAYQVIYDKDFQNSLASNKTETEKKYKSAIDELAAFKAGKINDTLSDNTFEKMLKYGTFMATLVQAKSSEEVEAAIEAFALPSGSARIKRQTPFNVSLNAYSGVFLGWEQIKGVDRPACFKKGYEAFNSYGITAPIGIAVSTSKWGWSFTGFMSVVDLGAVTAFRFSNDSTESVPKIELKEIISPGIFFSLGLPKCPLSLNVGYQAGPLLREVNQVENTYEKKYTRLSFSLNVDIPILNFYTKSKK